MKVAFEIIALAEYAEWQAKDAKIARKIYELIQSIVRDGPMAGIGKPEKLKGRNGMYSRRIDKENRLTYLYSATEITITHCKGHYE